MSDDEPKIIKEFRGLYDYVRLMGEHVNQIHTRLERIEKNINEIVSNQRNHNTEVAKEIGTIKANMVYRSEFNDFIEKMKSSMGEELPSLPILRKEPTQEGEAQQRSSEH
jgi:DNA anti-recombination protein RmuC